MIVFIELESLFNLANHVRCLLSSEDNCCKDDIAKRLEKLLHRVYSDYNNYINEEDTSTINCVEDVTQALLKQYGIKQPIRLRVLCDISLVLDLGETHVTDTERIR